MAHTSRTTGGLGLPVDFFLDLFLGLGILIVGLTAIYFVWRLPATVAGLALVCFFGWLGVRAARVHWKLPSIDWPGFGLALVALFADGLIVLALFHARTTETLISPWQVMHPAVFILYGLASIYAFVACRRLGWGWGVIVASIHLAVAFSVSAIVYGIGFGYDPFVHEAATSYIFTHGVIFPKQPFYIGQYGLVVAIQRMTHFGIHAIQTVLVPVMASILLVIASYVRSCLDEHPSSPATVLAIFLIMPFAPFAFTVPYNLALVFFVVVVLLLPFTKTRSVHLALWAMALAAVCIHPLIGIPAVCLVVLSSVRLREISTFGLAVLFTALVLVSALEVYALRNGGKLVVPDMTVIEQAARGFMQPVFSPSALHPFWTALYAFYYALLPMLFVIGCLSFLRSRQIRRDASIAIGCAIGCAVAAVITALTVRFRNIISYEQMEFSYRLVNIAPWFVLGGLVRAAQYAERRTPHIALVVICPLVVSAWFIAYPTFTPVYSVYAPGIGQLDLDTVRRIEDVAAGSPYVALTPQMTSAAALQRIGFERSLQTDEGQVYPYAIPTGGSLYGKYFSMFYGGDALTAVREAGVYGHTPLVFVAIPWAWDPRGHILDELKKSASSTEWIDDRWLFTFYFSPTSTQSSP